MHDKDYDAFFETDDTEKKGEEQLKELLAGYDSVKQKKLSVGNKVSGIVTRTTDDYLFVNIGMKSEGAIKTAEFTDSTGVCSVKTGDTVDAFVSSLTGGEVVLGRTMGQNSASGMQDLRAAMQNSIPVSGKVTAVNKGGFSVKIMGRQAFCPVSQIDLKYVEEPMQYLDQTLQFVIMRIDEGGRNIVVSRIPLLEEGLAKTIDNYAAAIESGTVYKGKVTRIAPFGLFVDMEGVDGLVHISEVAWERVENLEERFVIGDQVEYRILKVEKKEPLRESRISLSIKQAQTDPWSTVSDVLHAGQTVSGIITRLANFGAFVEVASGIEGLVHVSEMSWGKRINHPSEVVTVGQSVSVNILAIDESKKTVSCSLKDPASDPWAMVSQQFTVGATVQGTIARQSRFGYFVDLTDGVTGLLMHSDIAADKKGSLKTASTINVTIKNIDVESRRIGLTCGVVADDADAAAAQEYIKQKEAVPAYKPESSLGMALKAALQKSKTGGAA